MKKNTFPKRTKIVCTIGPASQSVSTLTRMIKKGMNVARLNFSHGSYEHHKMLIDNIRVAAKKCAVPVALLQDIQGPKVRLGSLGLPKKGVELKEGEDVVLLPEKKAGKITSVKAKFLPVQYEKLHKYVHKGSDIFIDDAMIQLKVVHVERDKIFCKVRVGGPVIAHKGINVPGADFDLPTITTKDREDLKFGLKLGMDYVAVSFVKEAADIQSVRRLIKRLLGSRNNVLLIAKIETPQAVDNFAAVLQVADGIMIARGDLGIEISAAGVPVVQKDIIKACVHAAKPVIVATHMLNSMVHEVMPTRAEVSDVANAVVDHADAVMLSGETAFGDFPVEAVSVMSETIFATEVSPYDDFSGVLADDRGQSRQTGMIDNAFSLARDIKARAVLIFTDSLSSVQVLSSRRSEQVELIAVASDAQLYRQMALFWGVVPIFSQGSSASAAWIRRSVALLRRKKLLKKGDEIVIAHDILSGSDKFKAAVRIYKI